MTKEADTLEMVRLFATAVSPVKRVSLVKLGIFWLVSCIINFAILLYFYGASFEPWIDKLSSWGVLDVVLLGVAGIAAAFYFYTSSIPGHKLSAKSFLLASSFFSFWVVGALFAAYLEMQSLESIDISGGFGCMLAAGLFMLAPVAVLLFQAKGLVPLSPARTACSAVFVAFSAAMFAYQFHCPDVSAVHTLVWHYSPIFLLLMAGAYIGSKVLKWK